MPYITVQCPSEEECQLEIFFEMDGENIPATRVNPPEFAAAIVDNVGARCSMCGHFFSNEEHAQLTRDAQKAADEYKWPTKADYDS